MARRRRGANVLIILLPGKLHKGLSCGITITVEILGEDSRSQVAETCVAALAMVKDFDVFPDGGLGLCAAYK